MARRILIADDERTIADTLGTIVGLHGYEVRTAYDGGQAVETARQWQPHIFLTDLVMPVMDGFEAAIAICRILPDPAGVPGFTAFGSGVDSGSGERTAAKGV
jgi:CheY-like chemotaxis protein